MKERGILFSEDMTWIRQASSRIRVTPAEYAEALNNGQKLCGKCRRSLPREKEFFGTDSARRDQLRSHCRECAAKHKKIEYYANRSKHRERQLRYQQNNRQKLYAYNAKWQRKRGAALRSEMLAAYGGRCACCGESEPIFLDLDHVHNNGNVHRREVGNNVQVMLQIKSKGWPTDDFQVLCSNCNQGKARNKGICPHQKNVLCS